MLFSPDSQLIMACHISGVYDVNRNTTLPNDDFELVRHWASSIVDLKLKGVIFHNNFSESTIATFQNEYVHFIKVKYDSKLNPNVFRYLVYRDFLRKNAIKSAFFTDVSDVIVRQNPFVHPYFLENPTAIFCGDEPKILQNDWMIAHSEHFRNQLSDYADYEEQFKESTLLNCGIIGGNINPIQNFIEQLSAIHESFNQDNKTAYTGDMGAFNYLIRTQFNDKIKHGTPVNTIFKEYQTERTDCWFQHK